MVRPVQMLEVVAMQLDRLIENQIEWELAPIASLLSVISDNNKQGQRILFVPTKNRIRFCTYLYLVSREQERH